MFAFGLFPFNFWPGNHLRWARDGPGIEFHRTAILSTDRTLFPVAAGPRSDRAAPAALTLELWLRPGAEPENGIPSILSFFDGRIPENLTVGQWRSSILLRAPSPDPARARTPRETGLRDALRAGQTRFVTIACDPAGTTFYLDGVQARHDPGFRLDPGRLAGRLLLGNSARESRTWQGTILGLAVHDRALDAAEVAERHAAWTTGAGAPSDTPGLLALYRLDEGAGRVIRDRSPGEHDLAFTGRFRVPRKPVLGPPGSGFPPRPHPWRDIVVNALGFIPFGFVFAAQLSRRCPWRPLRTVVLTVLMGLGISLAIELAQVFLPSRDSSATDLLNNSLGTFLGALGWMAAGRWWEPVKAASTQR